MKKLSFFNIVGKYFCLFCYFGACSESFQAILENHLITCVGKDFRDHLIQPLPFFKKTMETETQGDKEISLRTRIWVFSSQSL